MLALNTKIQWNDIFQGKACLFRGIITGRTERSYDVFGEEVVKKTKVRSIFDVNDETIKVLSEDVQTNIDFVNWTPAWN